MSFIDCNEQIFVKKYIRENRPHCDHGKWTGGGSNWVHPGHDAKRQITHKHRVRELAIESLGGACVQCGVSESLEFDHVNPIEKSFEIDYLLKDTWGSPRLERELDKCQLLCKLCHQAKTAQEAGQSATAKQDQLEALINQYGRTA